MPDMKTFPSVGYFRDREKYGEDPRIPARSESSLAIFVVGRQMTARLVSSPWIPEILEKAKRALGETIEAEKIFYTRQLDELEAEIILAKQKRGITPSNGDAWYPKKEELEKAVAACRLAHTRHIHALGKEKILPPQVGPLFADTSRTISETKDARLAVYVHRLMVPFLSPHRGEFFGLPIIPRQPAN